MIKTFFSNNNVEISEWCITGEALYKSLKSSKRDPELQKIIDIINKNNLELNYKIDELKEIFFWITIPEETRQLKLDILEKIFLEIFFPKTWNNKINKISQSTIVHFFTLCRKNNNISNMMSDILNHIFSIFENHPDKKIPTQRINTTYELTSVLSYYYKEKKYLKIEQLVTEKWPQSSWSIFLVARSIRDIDNKINFLKIPGIIQQISEEHTKRIIKISRNNKDLIACFDVPHRTVSWVRHAFHSIWINI